ncbi:MAG TPA: hypothetical protein VMZ69_10740 [Saprospiraceae bacterium]|nr:hypothetical protein [Saprospiraceae bacterium]
MLFLLSMLPHGDLDQRINDISLEIQASPENMELRLKRGELFIQHEEYTKAKADFLSCLQHKFKNEYVFLGLGTSYLFEGLIDSSLYYVEQAIALAPDHLSSYELKAKVLMHANRNCEAADVYQYILNKADHPSPFIFIQASSAYNLCETEGSIDNAISVLQSGLKIIPDNRILQYQLISIYKEVNEFDKAVELQSSIIAFSTFKVRPYLERAKIYAEINKNQLAKDDISSALINWDLLPQHKKDLPAMDALKKEILALKAELEN